MSELIKIDIDRPPRADRWWAKRRLRRISWVLYRAEELLSVRIELRAQRRSRKGVHVVAEVMGRISPPEIVAVQACCGSDPIRELLNLHRIRKGWKAWNVMFTEKREYKNGRELKGRHSQERLI